MNKETYQEVLLELACSISGEFDLQRLLRHCLPLFQRKLNCTLAAVVKTSTGSVVTEHVVPHAVGASTEYNDVVARLVNDIPPDGRGELSMLKGDRAVYYGFPLDGFGRLVVGRETPFEAYFLQEFRLVCSVLERACLACVEVERRAGAELVRQGRPCLVESFVEISEQKKAEAELKESLSLLEATLESTADGILVVDGSGRIKNFNRQFQDLWRLPSDILERRDDDEALAAALPHLDAPEAFLRRVRQLWAEPERKGDGVLHFKDGRVVEYYSSPQYVGDRITGRVWSFRDVTAAHCARQEQEKLLHQIAAVNEELTHFAYVVSHDLKAPLRGIKMLTEWLYEDYAEQLGDEARENLDLLQNRVERMHSLIEGVLQYSRVGRIKEDLVDIDLNTLLPGIIDAIAAPEHIHIRVEGSLPMIECEKTRVIQVFQNLLTNAVKYMDKAAGRIIVACAEDDEAWTFRVSDNGPGIEEKYFDRIFKIFQTLAPRDEFESTGVGLTLVKKIVEHYGGRIWLTSEVGKGTTFFFTLPRDTMRICHERLQAGAAD